MPNSGSNTFHEEGTAAVHRLRRALASALASVGADASEPQELSRRFKLDKTLTWRLSRVIREEDAWEAVIHIPGRPSIRTLIQRLESDGAPAAKVEDVRQAMDGFERFVEVHSGNRETLEIMVGAANRPSSPKRLELFRKQGFQAASAAWGIQARVQFSCHLMVPSSEPDMLDLASIVGLVDLRRLRPNVPWAVARADAWDDENTEIDARPEPLWPECLCEGVPVVPEFCSEPLPTFRLKRSPGGNRRFEIAEGELGYTGAATMVMAWKWPRTASVFASAPGEVGEHGLHLTTPVELAIHDLLVHTSMEFALTPQAASYSELPGGPKYPDEGPDTGRMPMPEDVVDLGSAPPSLTTLEIPRYQEMIERAAGQLGCTLGDFHGFRHRVAYPTIPTIAMLRHPLRNR